MSAISFIAGLGAGYLKGSDDVADRNRQTALDKITFDRAARDTQDYNRVQSARQALAGASAPLPVETSLGVGPPADDGSVPQTVYKVGAQQFADQGVAQQAANDPTARDGRISAVLRGQDPIEAQRFEQGNKQAQLTDLQLKQHVQTAQDEGTMRGLSAALSGQSPQQVADIYNANGDRKVRDLKITPITVDHPVLGKQQSVSISGVDGKGNAFTVPDALDASFRLFSAEKQFGLLAKANEDGITNKQKDRALNIQQQNSDTNEAYRRDQGAAATVRAAAASQPRSTGGGSATERMSEADKEEYKGVKDQVRAIQSEITKAQASDSFNPDSANAKALKTQLASLNMRGGAILSRYAESDSTPDPLGLRGSQSSSSNQISPAVQASRDAQAGQQMIANELGGNIDQARDGLAKLQAAVQKSTGDARAIFQRQANILQAGIDANNNRPAPARLAAQGVAPAATPVVFRQPQQAVPQQAAAPEQIPSPPPEFRQIGLTQQPNPAFAEWSQRFGKAYAEQQAAAQAQAQQAASAARASFNPYAQNRVR